MSVKKFILSAGFILASMSAPFGVAEEIRIPVGQQAKNQAAIDMPSTGTSKEVVRNLFGDPLEEIPPKGNPPISRWKYEGFTVYFDNDRVIHSVRNFQPKATIPAQENDQDTDEQDNTARTIQRDS